MFFVPGGRKRRDEKKFECSIDVCCASKGLFDLFDLFFSFSFLFLQLEGQRVKEMKGNKHRF